jgi:hypothetical protein
MGTGALNLPPKLRIRLILLLSPNSYRELSVKVWEKLSGKNMRWISHQYLRIEAIPSAKSVLLATSPGIS